MKVEIAIIGGGTAGLCAAARLVELGKAPLLLEAGTYPAHKVCGEFLSPECIPYLHQWGIAPIPIKNVELNTSKRHVSFPFPRPAGALSHLQLDPPLAHYAATRGATIKTNAALWEFYPKSHTQAAHQLLLSTGEAIEADQIIIATGRMPGYRVSSPPMPYIGFKAHFRNINSAAHLAMYSLPGAYLGIVPIEEEKFNVACLASAEKVRKYDTPQLFIEDVIASSPALQICFTSAENLFDQWMVASIPEFGIKQTPPWLDAYFIGDAAVTIPPACGGGLAMAILGGRLAAEYALHRQAHAFQKQWTYRCRTPVFWAKHLHNFMLSPRWSAPLMHLVRYSPWVSKKIFELTRQPTL